MALPNDDPSIQISAPPARITTEISGNSTSQSHSTSGPQSGKRAIQVSMTDRALVVTVVTLFFVAFATQFCSAKAFFSGGTIGNWFLNALTNCGKWIFGGIGDIATSIYLTITIRLTLGLISESEYPLQLQHSKTMSTREYSSC